MARSRPQSATLYDFADRDLMLKIRAETNGHGVSTHDLADLLGFDEEHARNVGIRLAWMRRYGFVAFDTDERTWSLSKSGNRIADSLIRARSIRVVEQMPDESMVDVMAHVTSRWQHADPVLATMLRREFLFGTQKR